MRSETQSTTRTSRPNGGRISKSTPKASEAHTMINALQQIPVLGGLPLVASLPLLAKNEVAFRNRLTRGNPDICRVGAGPLSVVLIGNKDLCQEALTCIDEFDKTPTITATARPTFGNGILLIANRPHRARRRMLQPAFNHSRVNSYATTISQHASQAAKWTDGQV